MASEPFHQSRREMLTSSATTAAAVSSSGCEPAKAARLANAVPTYEGAMTANGKSQARAAFGGVAHLPWRVEAAEAAMPRGAAEMSHTVFAGARPTDDNAFKIQLATRTLAAVLAEVKP